MSTSDTTSTYAQDRAAMRCVYLIDYVTPSGRLVKQHRSVADHDFTNWVYDPTDMYAATCKRCGRRN